MTEYTPSWNPRNGRPVGLNKLQDMFMTEENLIRRDQDAGYIIAWKRKYEFETGKFKDETMTYGEARKKCEELNAENPENTYWPEKLKQDPEWHLVYE